MLLTSGLQAAKGGKTKRQELLEFKVKEHWRTS